MRYIHADALANIDSTHRERKELYIKALEQEVLRLKDTFSGISRDKDTLAEENRQLKELLARNGIAWGGVGGIDELTQNPSNGYTSSGSISGSYTPGSQSVSPLHAPHAHGRFQGPPPTLGGSTNGRSMAQQQVQQGLDYDQTGIDFVLTYENPARAYMSPPPQ